MQWYFSYIRDGIGYFFGTLALHDNTMGFFSQIQVDHALYMVRISPFLQDENAFLYIHNNIDQWPEFASSNMHKVPVGKYQPTINGGWISPFQVPVYISSISVSTFADFVLNFREKMPRTLGDVSVRTMA